MNGEDESSLEVSEPETQFVPQENDEEELWEVIEITAEKNRQYKVKWAGTDPKTRKPWPQSWVPKHDCTDDLVKTWKTAQALKKKEAASRKSGKGLTVGSKKARSSVVSRSSAVARGSTASSSSTAKNVRSNGTTPVAGPSTVNANGKRKHSPLESVNSDDLPTIGAVIEPPPRKKRKLEVEPVVEADGSDEDATPVARVGRAGAEKIASGKGKRKVAETTDDDEVEEDEIGVIKERKGKAVTRKKELLRDDQSSVASSRIKTPATKKAKAKVSIAASRRSSTTQRAVSPASSSDHEPSPQPLKGALPKQSEPLFLPNHPDDEPSSPARPPSTRHQSYIPLAEERTSSPDIELPASPINDLSRLSPTGQAQLAAFDAFMAKGNRSVNGKSVPLRIHEEIDINRMYDEYVDFDPQDEAEPPSKSARALNGLSKAPISSPPTSPPPLRAKGSAEPLEPASDQDDSHPMTSSPPPLKPKQARGGNGYTSNNNSFRQGIIPETETESSTNNTQSQPQLTPPPVPRIIEPPADDSIMNTPARASLIRRMRPRTPGSASGSKLSLIDEANIYDPLDHDYDDGGAQPTSPEEWLTITKNKTNVSGKSLRPVPMLSPSKFAPHLPPHSPISNQATEEAEVEELMSSIEQFSSSENEGSGSGPHRTKKQRRDKGKGRRTEPEPAPEVESQAQVAAQDTSITEDDNTMELSVMARGQKMAEAARKERLAREKTLAGETSGQKVSLLDLLRAGGNKGNNKGKRRERMKDKKQPFGHRHGQRDGSAAPTKETEAGISNAQTKLGAQGDRSPSAEVGVRRNPEFVTEGAHEMDETDADADGEDEADVIATIDLREEEEESTQDLMADMRRRANEVDVEMDWNHTGPTETPGEPDTQQEPETDLGQAAAGSETEEVPPAGFLPKEGPPLQHNDSADDIVVDAKAPVIPPPRSRSSSRPKSVSGPSKPPGSAHEESQLILPPTASTRQSTPDPNPQSISQDEPEHLGAAMALLNTKSQEIAKLDALLVAEQAKSEILSREIEALRASLISATSEPRPKEAELELELYEARSLLAQEKSAWYAERSKMTASVEALTRDKASAQTDREFFREQYTKASGFVSSVRRENEELESRTRIAEEQTTAGVALIKATFEKRIEKLEDDAKHWRTIALFIMEKDQRTNDEIRRRAGEEPELRARYEDLEEQYKSINEEVSNLEDDLEQKEATIQRLGTEVEVWKKEITRLNVQLNEAQTKYERSNKGEGSQGDHEMLYRCQWRPEGGNDPCEGLFVSVEELQAHLYTGGHLHD